MAKVFDSKIFNAEVFQKYIDRIPDLKKNELLKSGALKACPELAGQLVDGVGGNFIVRPFKGLLDGTPDNYDGATDISNTTTDTYKQGIIVIGRAKGFKEKDFSYEVTGVDFMSNVGDQVAKYWENINQGLLLSILKGIFGISALSSHVYTVAGVMGATTLNSAIQKACGDNKGAFNLAIMHSAVSTQLENLNLLEYLKYTDKTGVQRNLAMGTWNGRIVIVDDGVPTSDVAAVYTLTSDVALDNDKTYYTRSGSAGSYVYTAVTSPNVANIGTYYERTAEAYTEYTTYVLGNGAFDYCNVGAKVPVEMQRDPKTNGGEDILYTRERLVLAPYGISFIVANITSNSPTDIELETAANWELVKNSGGSATINHKAIPFVKIVSRSN